MTDTTKKTIITFLDALNDRYGSEDTTEYDQGAFLVGFGGKNAKNNKKWEMVGMEKTRKQQSNHGRLQTIVLKDAMITRPEKDGEEGKDEIKAAKLVGCSEVDLSGNFELNVADVNVIVDAVPNLQLLQLNRIPLLLSSEERVGLKEKLLAEGRLEVVKKVGAVASSSSSSAADTPTEIVAKVIPELPKCFIDPSFNTASRLLTATWPKLKQLVLNGTGITSLMPLRGLTLEACEEIHLDMNNISELFPSSPSTTSAASLRSEFAGLANVKIVSLALNQLADWHGASGLHLITVNAFPKLTSLLVGGNPLPNLPLKELEESSSEAAPTTEADVTPITHLRNLLAQMIMMDISDNKGINDHVTSLEAIRKFSPLLTAIRVSYETLFAEKSKYPTEAIARNLTIASLPAITTLNRAAVRPKERVDAEIYYIQRCVSEFPELRVQQFATATPSATEGESASAAVSSSSSPANLDAATMTLEQLTAGIEDASVISKTLASYPRYFVLRQQYKQYIIAQQQGAGGAGATAGNGFMADVTIRADAFADQKKRLPTTLTVQKVKTLAAALFSGLDASQMEVSFWITAGRGDNVAIPLVLENEMQSLGFYGVPNGATIKIRDLRDKKSL